MATCLKRAMVTLRPEWEPKLNRLKKERFYNDTHAEMFRYLIALGLDTLEHKTTLKSGESSNHEDREGGDDA